MKTPLSTHAMLLVLGLGSLAASDTAIITDRISGEELSARQQASAGILARVSTPSVPAPDVRPEHRRILEHSEILSRGGFWTLVPDGAVLHLPAEMTERHGKGASGEFIPWAEFLRRNHAWLLPFEVSLEVAGGHEPIDEQQAEAWTEQQRIVVAVHRGGPISVLRPAPETTQPE